MATSNAVKKWEVPKQDGNKRKLKLYNSFTKNKETFVPISGKRVFWYNCGPTVYDAAHMGHARSYITFDIIRRILQDYFRFDVLFVMNITDIDDKIIKRARQQYLLRRYVDNRKDVAENGFKEDLAKAIDYYNNKLNAETDSDKKNMMIRLLSDVQKVMNSININSVNDVKDVFMEWLDSVEGHTIDDNSVFESLPRQYELEFYKDMQALNVLPADVVTRVSEYVPEIVEYIKKIIENGYAYESNGSVYFDTVKFGDSPKHQYAKLVPEAVGDKKAMIEGEGVLSSDLKVNEKKHPNDFALWKLSKPGEPHWQSPWGKGRPGWHIECSVMASAILGNTLDIHSGGYDLKFPHHDNEIAQAESYYDTGDNWVQYFLHSGHLTISGCKMSKSLKNFITIGDALNKHTSRQLRFAFLLHSWKDTLDYSENSMHDAINYEKFVNEFFLAVKDILRSSNLNKFEKWTQLEIDLNNRFYETIAGVDDALCDNIDTRTALDLIRELITSCNIYLKSIPNPNASLLKNVAEFITRIFGTFGLIEDTKVDIGFGATSQNEATNKEEIIMPLLEVLCNFREDMRSIAKDSKINQILQKCDELRDDILPNLGIKIEDKEVCGVVKTVKKLVDKETLLREKEEKLRIEEEKRKAKEKRKLEQLEAQALKDAQKKINPVDMFRSDTNYSQFDEKGFPIADKEGNPLSKSQIKNLTKLYQKQEKMYNEYLQSVKQ
ncbi:cysteine--tRNA ligase: cytoplasmic-like protein [Leptotrombidium deliense]|uniref:Cysteine--tRNA ligase, cytoplasmic n=1 Tax=Leptotrombidium deliense TaxID=299467 RepID=A0A443SW60_9ACAR|nr:cysteine--tRNA ligase: cytoplasmic-like protein [Leptotrombidium deliense]